MYIVPQRLALLKASPLELLSLLHMYVAHRPATDVMSHAAIRGTSKTALLAIRQRF